jgi:nitroreductase
MESIFEVIKKRYSVRSYIDKAVEKEKLQKIGDCLCEIKNGPLGSGVRFGIVDATDYEQGELKKLGTYGMLKGPRIFIAGAVRKNKTAMEDFGYCMEKIILGATDLGLGTCWLGGALNRSTFAEKLNAKADELIPAVTPIGYAADKRTLTDNLARMVAGSTNRKKPEELFFDRSAGEPLGPDSAGQYSQVLEAVRWAPSASNKQPWRIIRDADNAWHFYLKENTVYNNIYKDIKLQNVDMGIAMCHFELAAAELGLKGVWEIKDPPLKSGDLKYIVSWIPQ